MLEYTCDNNVNSYLNKTFLGNGNNWKTFQTYTITMQTSMNLFQFVCNNSSVGPAGLIFSLKDNSENVLLRSDNASLSRLTSNSLTYFSQYNSSIPILYYK